MQRSRYLKKQVYLEIELLSAEQFVKKHSTTQAEGLLISKANFLVLI